MKKKEVSPQQKRAVYLACGIIIAITVFFCAVVLVSALMNPSPSESEPQTTEETSEVGTATFDEIYYAYKENELVADDLYQYNRYRVTAKINGMTNDGLFNMTGGAMLTLETKVDNTIVFFYAEFEKEQEENLKSVKVGDAITFEGKCLDAGNWTECELIME
ncbi:MAG: hypothetical protein ACI3XN_04140 [Eubacteriales bacterium]